MISYRAWSQYPKTYRAHEISILADWIRQCASGNVAGLPGVGKSNLLGFLCNRPDVIQSVLAPDQTTVTLVHIDLNNLADDKIATFYRNILRSLYESGDQFEDELQQTIINLYQENKGVRDPFLVQSALRQLLLQFRVQQHRVGFIFDRFDDFCETATLPMTNALRGLRDSFKDILFYIMGMRQEAAYISDPSSLGELYEILDTRVCWVKPMNREDARLLIEQETLLSNELFSDHSLEAFIQLSGGFPSLLKAICSLWLTLPDVSKTSNWESILLADPSVDYRLQEILNGLNQEELLVLSKIEKLSRLNETADPFHKLEQQHPGIIDRLVLKGVCKTHNRKGWFITSRLLSSYLAAVKGQGKGRLWLDETIGQAYQGETLIQNLTPLEREVLHFLIRYPRIRHTKTDLIVNAWPDELRKEGVTDDSLYQVIAGLRKKIEPLPSKPCYIVNWRGKPEGGYQLFAEGRPA